MSRTDCSFKELKDWFIAEDFPTKYKLEPSDREGIMGLLIKNETEVICMIYAQPMWRLQIDIGVAIMRDELSARVNKKVREIKLCDEIEINPFQNETCTGLYLNGDNAIITTNSGKYEMHLDDNIVVCEK